MGLIPANSWAEGVQRLARLRTSPIARNAGWMFAGDGAKVGIQAIYFIIIARELGSAAYGAFASVLAMVGILGSFATWGWGSLLVKYVSRDRDTFPGFWGQTLCVALISGGSLCGIALLASFLIFGDTIALPLALLVALADLIFFRLLVLCGSAYQAHERLDRTAALQLLLSVARLCAAGLMAVSFTNSTATHWAALYCASTAVAATAALVLTTKELGIPRFGRPFRRVDLVEGFHFSVSLSSATIYNDVDKTMLGQLGPFAAVGVYSAAYRAIDAAFMPVRSLLFASYAKFFQQGAFGVNQTVALARRLLLPSLTYSVLASATLVAVAPIFSVVLGPDFGESVTAVRFLAAIPVLRSIQVFASDALTGAGYQNWRSVLQFSVAIGNIGLNLLLIPAFSWRGAAMTSLLSDALLAVGMWALVWAAMRRETDARACLPVNVSDPVTENV